MTLMQAAATTARRVVDMHDDGAGGAAGAGSRDAGSQDGAAVDRRTSARQRESWRSGAPVGRARAGSVVGGMQGTAVGEPSALSAGAATARRASVTAAPRPPAQPRASARAPPPDAPRHRLVVESATVGR